MNIHAPVLYHPFPSHIPIISAVVVGVLVLVSIILVEWRGDRGFGGNMGATVLGIFLGSVFGGFAALIAAFLVVPSMDRYAGHAEFKGDINAFVVKNFDVKEADFRDLDEGQYGKVKFNDGTVVH